MTTGYLVLADGTVFEGEPIGAPGTTVGEAVFTTGTTGYQEVLTDPSYAGQLVCMTAPQMGNTGTTAEDEEAPSPALAGFIVHELSPVASNWRAEENLDAYLRRHGVVGLARVDTRALTRHIRGQGAQMAAIGSAPVETLSAQAAAAPPMSGRDLTGEVTTSEPYTWTDGLGPWAASADDGPRPDATGLRVVALDFGIKRNILRCLADLGCEVRVLPARASAEQVLAEQPDGVFLSNGPGDPSAVTYAADTVRALVDAKPVFGICLGFQLLALALGGRTYKLKFGHRGLNHPVKDLGRGRVEITTQNHGFCVDASSLEDRCRVTHVHLNDGTCQGLEDLRSGAFGVQYHPEASAGPHDSRYLFARFVERMREHRG
ncbi:MAG: glutamine-hydrolyzing carbamoyl-phosphate synthase small subunit [Sandaracinaceae bacterium]